VDSFGPGNSWAANLDAAWGVGEKSTVDTFCENVKRGWGFSREKGGGMRILTVFNHRRKGEV